MSTTHKWTMDELRRLFKVLSDAWIDEMIVRTGQDDPARFLLRHADVLSDGVEHTAVTPVNLDVLEKCSEDVRAATPTGVFYVTALFTCRVNRRCPDAYVLDQCPRELRGLFEACGPAQNGESYGSGGC